MARDLPPRMDPRHYAIKSHKGNPFGRDGKPPSQKLVERLEELRDDLFEVFEDNETQEVFERLINVFVDHLVGHA
jgi:hypothetical protein